MLKYLGITGFFKITIATKLQIFLNITTLNAKQCNEAIELKP